jgi:hypothetical protein
MTNRNFIEEETIESNYRFRIFDAGQHHSLSNSSNSILPIHHSFHLDDLNVVVSSLVAGATQINRGGIYGKKP